MHSEMYEKVKFYYDNGNWSINRVKQAVVKGRITEEEFKEITGKDYE